VPLTLTNSALNNASLVISDNTTVLASSSWDGTIAPPKSVSGSGSAPSGFSIGSTVVEVGSSAGVLLFDKPVAVVLAGVTGPVAYRPSGSTNWSQITNTCSGTYASPAAPAFPGECAISNGTDTKIYTYHLTSFASLAVVVPTPATGGGGGGATQTTPAVPAKKLDASVQKFDANKDNKIDLLDFNMLMANWGATGSNASDFDGSGTVDILDFNSLMVNWIG
jgi:hypothetical protein